MPSIGKTEIAIISQLVLFTFEHAQKERVILNHKPFVEHKLLEHIRFVSYTYTRYPITNQQIVIDAAHQRAWVSATEQTDFSARIIHDITITIYTRHLIGTLL